MLAHRGALVGACVVVGLVAVAVLGPWLAVDPARLDIAHGLSPAGAPLGPSERGVLGTDHLGRDVWARLVAGAGTSLVIAGAATAIAVVLGVVIGLVAGITGGRTDRVLMRIVDAALSLPVVLFAILLATILRQTSLGASNAPLVITLALLGWTQVARAVRSKTLVLARSEMVLAARAIGASTRRILARHVLPNVAGVIAVLVAVELAQNLLAESVLSYLGLGAPSEPTWGRMLHEGRSYYRTSPHLVLAPGAAIVIAVAGVYLVAEGLRDAFERGGRR